MMDTQHDLKYWYHQFKKKTIPTQTLNAYNERALFFEDVGALL